MFSASPFLPPPTDPRWVVVANLPREANEAWLRMLFAPVGLVEAIEFAGCEGAGSACLLFATAEQAAASLRFHGFVALGIAMQVRPRNAALLSSSGLNASDLTRPNPSAVSPMTRFRTNQSAVDVKPSHKNLYVLNLPLDATTDQLTGLFSSYGTVVHCVILAMLDAQARRRGFIDMSSPNEAKEAIEGLNGFVWHGYPIEVSYAIVQRSGGPFDQAIGRNIIKRNVPRNRFNTGPRRVPSDSAISSSIFGFSEGGEGQIASQSPYGRAMPPGFGSDLPSPAYSESSSRAPSEREEDATSATDPFTIFIAGLDPVAIIDDEDFRHALQPYGDVTAATLCRDEQGTSRGFGIVTFGNQDEATQACQSINGKVINGRRLSAHKYVYKTHPALLRPSLSYSPNGLGTSPLPTRPSPLQRRSYMNSNTSGNGAFTIVPPYPSTSLLQQIPMLNAQHSPRSPHLNPVWPLSPHINNTLHSTHRLDQIPMGSIGSPFAAAAPASDSWIPSSNSNPIRGNANTASFFKANGNSRPIEIKPDLREAGEKMGSKDKGSHGFEKQQLGDAFMPMPKATTPSSERFSDATVKNDNSDVHLERAGKDCSEGKSGDGGILSTPNYGNTPTNPMTLLRTPGTSCVPWNNSGSGGVAAGVAAGSVMGSNSLGLDAMSPESTLSMTSSTSSLSQLNTPEAVRGSDSTTIWGHSVAHDRMASSIRSGVSPSSWLSNSPPHCNDKRGVNIGGSAILSLQNNDVVEKASNRNGNAMAPVGHEKNSSSPLRVLRSFKDDNRVEASDT